MARTCEDFPCCGHEAGDCDGSLYGSDESIKAQVERDWREGHGYCDHAAGIFECDAYDEDPCDDEEHDCHSCVLRDDGWECSDCGRACLDNAHGQVEADTLSGVPS